MENSVEVILTDHAVDRAKERFGYNKKALMRMARKAYDNGIDSTTSEGGVSRYLKNKTIPYRKEGATAVVKAYGEGAYCFVNEKNEEGNTLAFLTTVFVFDKKIRNKMVGQQKHRKGDTNSSKNRE